MKLLDYYLNKVTTYRLVLYVLVIYNFLTIVFSLAGLLPYSPLSITVNFFITVAACYISNLVFAKLFKATTNTESVYITSFILSLLIHPEFPYNALFLVLASVIAMGSKYILAIHKRHIFNPAAIAIVLIGFISADHAATWWIGTPSMFLPVLIGGFLIIRKTQKEKMALTFLISYLFLMGVSVVIKGGDITQVLSLWQATIVGSALLFFASVMLTEPLTSPRISRLQIYYALLVSILFASSLFLVSPIPISAEIALVLGNIFSFIVTKNYRLELNLFETKKISPTLYAFYFKKPSNFSFLPGQYMEWTLDHKKPDLRGNRRYFSLASSPTEDTILLAFRQYTPSSSYKKAFIELPKGGKVIASSLSGEFVLPKDLSQPLCFIAGGIGITPFRSMIQYIVDTKTQCNIVLLNLVKIKEDEIFMDTFKAAEKYGVKTITTETEYTHTHLDEASVKKYVPDYKIRSFYLSGPQPMITVIKGMLKHLGIKKIKTDFFPGYN